MTRERRVDAPSTRDAMIDELFSNFFDLIWRIAMVWRIAMAISGYDIGVRTTRQRVLETPCLTRHFQRKIPPKPEAATAEFSVGQVVYITSGPSAGRALHIAKQEGRSARARLRSQVSGFPPQKPVRTILP